MTAETWVILAWLFVTSLVAATGWVALYHFAQRITALEAIRRKPRKAKVVPTV